MRVRDVASRLEISQTTVYQLIASGRLKCTRHGLGRGCIRVSEEQLTDYLKRAASVPAPAPARESMVL